MKKTIQRFGKQVGSTLGSGRRVVTDALYQKRKEEINQMPGSLVFQGVQKQEEVEIEHICFNQKDYQCDWLEGDAQNIDVIDIDSRHHHWINVYGLHNISKIQHIGDTFGIHRLVLEDILNTEHLPKVEHHPDYIFFTFKMIWYEPDRGMVNHEQVSFVLGPNYLLCFQERKGDVFESVRKRLQSATGRIRQRKADYLFYALADAVVDHYLLTLEMVDLHVEEQEDALLENQNLSAIEEIIALKKRVSRLKALIFPFKEAVNAMMKEENKLFEQDTLRFLRDLYDHLLHTVSMIDSAKDNIGSLLELNRSNQDMRMNRIIHVLTIVSAIFIPLTFIAGVYGMNFSYMPELQWRYGYPVVMLSMLALTFTMFVIMRKQKWL
jgi:magnesium transporter